MRTPTQAFTLATRIAEVKSELSAMHAKQRRLTEAIRQKETRLLRLEASRALRGAEPQPDPAHE